MQLQQSKKPRNWNDPETARLLLRRWTTNPNLFAKEVFNVDTWEVPPKGIRHGTHGQADIMPAVLKHRFVSCRAAQKTGKSAVAVVISNQWPLIHPGADVIWTAPVFKEIKRVLWKEFKRLRVNARFDLGGTVAKNADEGWIAPGGGCVFGNTVDNPEDLQGLSGPNNLWIIDEASGYREDLLQTVVGNLAGGGHILMIGNPNRTVGGFFDSHNVAKAAWHTMHISGLDTPNQTGIGKPIPGLSSPDTLKFYREAYGEGTPLWDVRVLGNFPSGAINTIVPLELVDAAKSRYEETTYEGALHVGIDPAGFGDDSSVMVFRRGWKILAMVVFHGLDGPDLAGRLLEALADIWIDGAPIRYRGERVVVKYDETGIGADLGSSLRRMSEAYGIDVFGCNNASTPTSQPQLGPGYANLGTQLYFGARDWLREGGAMPDDDDVPPEHRKAWARLDGELTGRTYAFDAKGCYQIERKPDFKKRIGRSPDHADAFTLAIYDPPTVGGIRVSGRRSTAAGLGGY